MSDRLSARDLTDLLLDEGSWTSWDSAPARAGVTEEYAAELDRAAEKAGVDESVLTGCGLLGGRTIAVIAGEFGFLAGSVGRDASDRLVDAITRATAEGLPLIGLTCSGGTRMQEGTPAFVQMVRIGAAISAHRAAGLPYVAYLRNPTTGGVMATWGSLGQVTLAEPGALTGFLGPRVYSAMYGEEFPPGIQLSDHLASVGVIDAVVTPTELREVLDKLLSALTPVTPGSSARRLPLGRPQADDPEVPEVDPWDAITRTRRADRPGIRELLARAATDVVELSGTQAGETDPALLLAVARFGGQPCVVVAQDRSTQSRETPLGPAGLRVARRGFQLAADWRIPVLSVIDTRGAELSAAAEEGAIAGEIARCLSDLVTCSAPTLGLMLGEGNGGGALAMLPADRIIAAQHAWLSPLPPEGASAIVHRDTDHAPQMAAAQQVLALALFRRGVVDRMVAEHPDAADESDAFCDRLGEVIAEELMGLLASGAGTPEQRAARYAF